MKTLFGVHAQVSFSNEISWLMKIMFAPAVLCSSGPVPCSVAADDVEADPADDIALLVE